MYIYATGAREREEGNCRRSLRKTERRGKVYIRVAQCYSLWGEREMAIVRGERKNERKGKSRGEEYGDGHLWL